jgi:GxxExxY protein
MELKSRGFDVEAQKQIKVYYKNKEVGVYYADLVINDLIILALKATEYIVEEFEWQLLNYLRGTNKEVGLLLNFGRKPEFRRKIFENKRKNLNDVAIE